MKRHKLVNQIQFQADWVDNSSFFFSWQLTDVPHIKKNLRSVQIGGPQLV